MNKDTHIFTGFTTFLRYFLQDAFPQLLDFSLKGNSIKKYHDYLQDEKMQSMSSDEIEKLNEKFPYGQVYLYLFCVIFIVVVLNIFIAIVQEAYSSSQSETKEHWAYGKKENSSMSLPIVKLNTKSNNENKIFNEEKDDL